MIDYIKNKYGNERVCSIGYKHKIATVEALEMACEHLGTSLSDKQEFLNLLPCNKCGVFPLRYSLPEEPKLQQLIINSNALDNIIDTTIALKDVFKGISAEPSFSFGDHVECVAISSESILNKVPLYINCDNYTMTQHDDDLQELQFAKIYFVDSEVMTIMQKTLDNIRLYSDSKDESKLNVNDIPLEDPSVYKLLSSGDIDGIFDDTSDNMKLYLRNIKPSSIEDLVAFVSLYNPCLMDNGMLDEFIERKHSKKKIEYLHPKLEEILECTYGQYIFQEQVMETACNIAGYNKVQADLLRRALGKKKPEEIKSQKSKFIDGASNNIGDRAQAIEIFDLMVTNSAYHYNRSHGVARSLMAYRAAYLKAHYLNEFMDARDSYFNR